MTERKFLGSVNHAAEQPTSDRFDGRLGLWCAKAPIRIADPNPDRDARDQAGAL
jgi:hypothetical protein